MNQLIPIMLAALAGAARQDVPEACDCEAEPAPPEEIVWLEAAGGWWMHPDRCELRRGSPGEGEALLEISWSGSPAMPEYYFRSRTGAWAVEGEPRFVDLRFAGPRIPGEPEMIGEDGENGLQFELTEDQRVRLRAAGALEILDRRDRSLPIGSVPAAEVETAIRILHACLAAEQPWADRAEARHAAITDWDPTPERVAEWERMAEPRPVREILEAVRAAALEPEAGERRSSLSGQPSRVIPAKAGTYEHKQRNAGLLAPLFSASPSVHGSRLSPG